MMSHDMDSDCGQRARVALLYMPLLGIITDHYTRLCRDFSTPTSASTQGFEKGDGDGDTDSLLSDDGTASLKRTSLFSDYMPSLSKVGERVGLGKRRGFVLNFDDVGQRRLPPFLCGRGLVFRYLLRVFLWLSSSGYAACKQYSHSGEHT